MERRRYLAAAGALGIAGLAGCFGDDGDDGDEGASGDGVADESNGDDDDEPDAGPAADPVETIDAFLEAAVAEDVDAMDELLHGSSPLRDLLAAQGPPEFEDVDDVERGETDVVVEDASVEDVLELEGASLFVDRDALETVVAEEDVVVVETELETSAALEGDTWVLATEDDEWRVFWVGGRAEPPDDPEGAFAEPIEDEANDVVADVEYDVDPGDDADDEFPDADFARVTLTDSPGTDADAVRIESTIAGDETELTGDEPGGWAGSWAIVALHPDGDQLVVTALSDGTGEVVHRERYEPSSSYSTR
ncbi:hypothetical protein [Natronobeatus ordinarius]|uniref:hypothetical protein n=1 Tax=Natronobeatus ordinarius TaxID=2963433 RepID=UPI0020CEC709|nr:hypothetical protein [Natronobeatus ordinarius]